MKSAERDLLYAKICKKLYVKPENYFDYQATTPMDSRVIGSMLPYMEESFGNPHSKNHHYGKEAAEAVEKSRQSVANVIGAEKEEIIFTSGATESNNLTLKGICECRNYKCHIITSPIEHKSVLDTCAYLSSKGASVTYLKVAQDGTYDYDEIERSIRPDTAIVSLAAMNNEIGNLYDLQKIGEICRKHNIIFHTDAAQAFGKVEIDVHKCGVSLMSMSGHKIYGPKGIGALYVNKNTFACLKKQVFGGAQEFGMRSGTVPVMLVVGLAAAANIMINESVVERKKLEELRRLFFEQVENRKISYQINGNHCWPGCISIAFKDVSSSEKLLEKIPEVSMSTGSACNSGCKGPSFVLATMQLDVERINSTVRIGFGRFTTVDEVKYLVKQISNAIDEIKNSK